MNNLYTNFGQVLEIFKKMPPTTGIIQPVGKSVSDGHMEIYLKCLPKPGS